MGTARLMICSSVSSHILTYSYAAWTDWTPRRFISKCPCTTRKRHQQVKNRRQNLAMVRRDPKFPPRKHSMIPEVRLNAMVAYNRFLESEMTWCFDLSFKALLRTKGTCFLPNSCFIVRRLTQKGCKERFARNTGPHEDPIWAAPKVGTRKE